MIQALAGITGGVSAIKRAVIKPSGAQPIDKAASKAAFDLAFAKTEARHVAAARQSIVSRGVIAAPRILTSPPANVTTTSGASATGTSSSANSNAGNGTSLVLTPGLPAVTGSAGTGSTSNTSTGSTTPISSTGAKPATTSGSTLDPTPASALDVLSAALTAAGIDPSSLNLTQHSDQVSYPGGSYTDNEITMTTPQGTHSFMVDLVLQNPNVTVTEIGHFLNG